MTFEWCILISNIMRIGIQCHPSLYYVMYLGALLFVVQRNVFISLSWFLLSLINCVLYVPTCQRALHAYVLLCKLVLCAYVPTCLACLRAHVPTCLACLRVYVSTCLACFRAHVPTCLECIFVPTFLRAHVMQLQITISFQ